MIENVDLSKKLDKEEYEKAMPELQLRMGELQRQARDLNIPVIIVFEGWDASGKGELINRLIHSLDPRGFKVYPVTAPNEEEKMRPFLWRFWIKTPAKGRISIFEKSWYRRMLSENMNIDLKKEDPMELLGDIKQFEKLNYFERDLYNNGNIIIKFFLHISKEEQKKRFDDLEKTPLTSWIISKVDWKVHRHYDKYLGLIDDFLELTDTDHAPWTIVEANNKKYATVKIYRTIISMMEKRIKEFNAEDIKALKANKQNVNISEYDPGKDPILNSIDLNKRLAENDYKQKLKLCQGIIKELQYKTYRKKLPIIVVFEGWDAAGKGGNIKRFTEEMDPRAYEVIPVSAPDGIEKNHHYLWRFWKEFPKKGYTTIFDRSWYGRVLVERVEGLTPPEEWKRAYSEINEMEETITDDGIILIKYWLQIDRDVQLQRFKERETDPAKQWKITEEDWRNRSKWDDYNAAIEEMLYRTDTKYAPWHIIESNDKYYSRIRTMETFIKTVEKAL